MKKILSANLIIILVFLFCSCGQIANTESETTTFTEPSTTFSETVKNTHNIQSTSKTTIAKSITEKSSEKAESTSKLIETTTKKSTSETTKKTGSNDIFCTVEINCKTIKANKKNLKPEKIEFVPKKYIILSKKTITLPEGSTAFDAIKKVCQENVCDENCVFCNKTGNIHLDFIYTPGFESDYIRGIHQLYEKDCGTRSGWMYSVNDVFPNYGCNKYQIKNNDTIEVLYTCDLGEDLK